MRIPVILTQEDFERLERLAQREERTVPQQVAYIVKRALRRMSTPTPAEPEAASHAQ